MSIIYLLKRNNEARTKMKTLTEAATKFMAKNPIKICTVMGVEFYESPSMGEDAPLRYINSEGKIKCSGFYETPEDHEVSTLLGCAEIELVKA